MHCWLSLSQYGFDFPHASCATVALLAVGLVEMGLTWMLDEVGDVHGSTDVGFTPMGFTAVGFTLMVPPVSQIFLAGLNICPGLQVTQAFCTVS